VPWGLKALTVSLALLCAGLPGCNKPKVTPQTEPPDQDLVLQTYRITGRVQYKITPLYSHLTQFLEKRGQVVHEYIVFVGPVNHNIGSSPAARIDFQRQVIGRSMVFALTGVFS
jgi:hypothetical protein